MKQILLTQNQCALVDDSDYESLSKHKWCAHKARDTFYAVRTIRIGKTGYMEHMHRLILGLTYGDGKQTDHIDGNGLNNQRSNLRICSSSENARNRCPTLGCSSEYKGVYWRAGMGKWQSCISLGERQIHLGYFTSEIEAAIAYNRAATEVFGKYARLNNITAMDLVEN